jgi:hypothetical protein
MRSIRRLVAASAAVAVAAALSACGGSGPANSVGFGGITLTSIVPSPLLGCAPQPFTITGTGFETLTGTTVQVRFVATGGATPFGGSTTAVVIGNVTSDTTITGTTPAMEICGIAAITFDVDVTLESGVSTIGTGGGISVTAGAPAITSISPNPIPAAIPTSFTLTGTGFGAAGTQVTIRFTSANPGDLNFDDGTANFADVHTTVTSDVSITAESPVARACTADFTASVQLIYPDGCCSVPTGTGFVTFLAPTLALMTGQFTTTGLVSTPLTLSGANLGVAGEIATLRFESDADLPIFAGGTSSSIEVPATLLTTATFSFVLPTATQCGLPTTTVNMRFTSPRGGSCVQSLAAYGTYNAPTVASVDIPVVPALVPTAVTLTGGFWGPATGQTVPVTLVSTGGGTPAIFADGTATSIDLVGTVVDPFTITMTTPSVTLCGIDSTTAQAVVRFPANGGTCALSPAGLLTFEAPALATAAPGGIQNDNLGGSLIGVLTPPVPFPDNNLFSLAGDEPFTLTALPGRDFGPVGTVVSVRFSTPGVDNWQGGAQDYDTVLGQVATPTTITGATPANDSISLSTQTVTVQAFWEDGSCSDTTIARYVPTSQRTFVVGTSIHTVDQNFTGAPGVIATPVGGISGPLALDTRRNRLFAFETVTPFLRALDTSPTMLPTPLAPAVVPENSILGNLPTTGAAMAPPHQELWVTSEPNDFLRVRDTATNSTATVAIATPPGTGPREIHYNAAADEMVVGFFGSSQIAVYSVSTRALVSLYVVPAPDANAGGLNEFWNGVMTIRPTASGDSRVYTVHDEPIGGSADALGTIALSTGVFTAVPADPLSTTPPAVPSALAYDTFRDQLVWWRGDTALGGVIQRTHPVSLAVLDAIGNPGNVLSISVDPLDDRYYSSNVGAAALEVWGDAPLGTFFASVALPVTGVNASTSP